MLILILFAILAGAGTALSPCVLPVLPALLSAGGAGGRRRPLGVVLGLSVTFTVTIVGIANVVDGVGLGSDPLRDLAIVVLLVFGLTLLLPSLAARIEAPLSRLARFGPRTRGDGFASGLLVGAALGFVYTPCAGPILAAVISVSAASGRSVAVAIAYTLGSAAVLLALTLGGRRLFDRVRRAGRGPQLQRVLGVIMILTAVAILTNQDVNFDQFVAQHIPNVNLTASLEKSHAVESRLHEITGHQREVRARERILDLRRLGERGARGSGEREPGQPARRRARPERPGRSAGIHRNRGLVQHAWRPAADARLAAWTRRAGRLLDLHVHQLHPHAPLPEGVECRLRQGRVDDRRCRDTGVRVREERQQRVRRDRPVRAALPGRPGQQHGHVERLRQPVLARRLPDRRDRPGALRGLRRGRLRQDRNGDPRAARARGRGRRRQGAPDRRDRAVARSDARDLPRHRARPGLGQRARRGSARLRTAADRRSGAQRLRLQRHLAHRRPAGDRDLAAPASTSSSRPRTSTSC